MRPAPVRQDKQITARPSLAAGVTAILLCSSGSAGTLVDQAFQDGFENRCDELVYRESFTQADGSPWPAAWTALGGSVALADVQAGQARLRPVISGYSLARMGAAVDTRDVEVRFSMILEDATAQGVGFYVRQNGGHLMLTNPPGAGYAVFVEGSFRGLAGIGVWREQNGHEIQIAHSPPGSPAPTQGTPYRVRFQVLQINPSTTQLRAKTWPADQPEPAGWQVSANNAQTDLQNRSGGIAVDSWNVATSGSISATTRIDDIEIERLCPAG